MSELKIIATIIIKEEFRSELMDVFKSVVDATRKEPGCISYNLNQDVKDATKYVILEQWKDQSAIDSHNESTHFQAFAKAIQGKIESLIIDVVKEVY